MNKYPQGSSAPPMSLLAWATFKKPCFASFTMTPEDEKIKSFPISSTFPLADPTPINPQAEMQIVDRVSISPQLLQHEEPLLLYCLSPLLDDTSLAGKGADDKNDYICPLTMSCISFPLKPPRTSSRPRRNNEDSKLCFAEKREEQKSPVPKLSADDEWMIRYRELCDYRQKHGSCSVPHNWENRPLANWVKRQRYQFTLKHNDKHSALSDEREEVLTRLGFQWRLNKTMWEDRFNELADFKDIHGHCNVPSRYAANQSLAIWVQSQRRQYKLFVQKTPSHMTMDRIKMLSSIGLEWYRRAA
jgi:hypothetical protein